MAAKSLPETITKEVLLHAVQNKLMACAKMFWDPNITAEQMYEELSCSVFSGDPKFDFLEQDSAIRYHYKDGSCSFMIDGIEVEVLDCRDMRKDPSINIERYADVCVLSVSYIDESECFNHHIIPEVWMYGSTTDDFGECVEVHPEFINAAREYIKQHKITKEMQEVKNG